MYRVPWEYMSHIKYKNNIKYNSVSSNTVFKY